MCIFFGWFRAPGIAGVVANFSVQANVTNFCQFQFSSVPSRPLLLRLRPRHDNGQVGPQSPVAGIYFAVGLGAQHNEQKLGENCRKWQKNTKNLKQKTENKKKMGKKSTPRYARQKNGKLNSRKKCSCAAAAQHQLEYPIPPVQELNPHLAPAPAALPAPHSTPGGGSSS